MSMSPRLNQVFFPKISVINNKMYVNVKLRQQLYDQIHEDENLERISSKSVSSAEDFEKPHQEDSIRFSTCSLNLEESPEIIFNADDWKESDIEGLFGDNKNLKFSKLK
jgi:hypothetical protein